MKRIEITRLQELDYASNEAMNTLCTNISFAGENIKKIMMTSCRPYEGKSYISMNLLRAMANLGRQTILVDADLRKSMMVGRYGIKTNGQNYGLAHYLAGMCKREDIICRTNIMNAHMVMTGKDVLNSLPLFNTPKFTALLDHLAEKYDVVLVDTPPVGALIDSAQISKSCDGVLFVVTANEISRKELKEAKAQIEAGGCPILGAVLNRVDIKKRGYRKYYKKGYYAPYYGTAEEGKKATSKRKKKVVV